MINEIICYKCKCDKCGHSWTTKTHAIPSVCAKCHSVKWNDKSTVEHIELSKPVTAPARSSDPVLDFIAKAQAIKGIEPIAVEPEPVSDQWTFTKDAPQFADDGNVYRQQYLASNPKRKRSVQVDEFDHEKIIR